MSKIIYDTEFKKTIVGLLNSGKTTSELATEYMVSLASINRWRRQYSKDKDTDFSSDKSSFNLKIKALEKELKETRLERDILKKAVSIFSKSDR
jgi:transposase